MAAGDLIFVSGQLGLDPETGEFKGEDLASQAHQALDNLGAILHAGNSGFGQVTAVDVYLADINDFVEFNGIYESYFTDHKPARAVVEVSALPKGGRVEIKCIATTR